MTSSSTKSRGIAILETDEESSVFLDEAEIDDHLSTASTTLVATQDSSENLFSTTDRNDEKAVDVGYEDDDFDESRSSPLTSTPERSKTSSTTSSQSLSSNNLKGTQYAAEEAAGPWTVPCMLCDYCKALMHVAS